MEFNQKVKRLAKDQKDDSWHQDIKLYGGNIQRNVDVKYHGVQICQDNKNEVHIKKRRHISFGSLGKLKTLGILSDEMHPNMKGQNLHKTSYSYLRQ
ncbi:unnamed protein product [Brachionus calyciflorus]|uniref:Uncharacterized protein n=1 Tax=Brachionus calyciflorus TaxID=104777 RepID=A0A814JPW5_9BILA|nr:unnamed protein product [Brachionus calyciflorus]